MWAETSDAGVALYAKLLSEAEAKKESADGSVGESKPRLMHLVCMTQTTAHNASKEQWRIWPYLLWLVLSLVFLFACSRPDCVCVCVFVCVCVCVFVWPRVVGQLQPGTQQPGTKEAQSVAGAQSLRVGIKRLGKELKALQRSESLAKGIFTVELDCDNVFEVRRCDSATATFTHMYTHLHTHTHTYTHIHTCTPTLTLTLTLTTSNC